MKRCHGAMLVLSLVACATRASAMPFVTCDITNAAIFRLDSDSYRLHVEVNVGIWGLEPDEFAGFHAFMLSPRLGDYQYNPSNNSQEGQNYPGGWFLSPGARSTWLRLPVFEYDFDTADGLGDLPVDLGYQAGFDWYRDIPDFLPEYLGWVDAGGSLSVPQAAAEPPAWLLLSCGLAAGLLAIRRYR